ncbi:hypothetical protein J5N97_014089 [Dioscorea zingiberensis]|uniref:Exostosin GT47 domain-containing protein n=1 Tax=Dioscorea zingiberensis TaxID=325984 RepID=A0A9D5HJ62_9LILI|nr:hypothetical protein J5N97_014089 [Dioscorea zingiberensis]
MADRSIHVLGLRCRKPLFLFFGFVALLFAFSWFYFFGFAAGRAPIVGRSVLPSSKILSVVESTGGAEMELAGHQDRQHERCDPERARLKVFMYDLPAEFHFGLLGWTPKGDGVWPDIKEEKIPDYPGGLNLQHSIEYWLTLDLLSSRFGDRRGPCIAVRVMDSREADVVFVPFFSSLSYNRHSKVTPPMKESTNKMLQNKLVQFLVSQEEWKRSGGRDHVVMAHHPKQHA